MATSSIEKWTGSSSSQVFRSAFPTCRQRDEACIGSDPDKNEIPIRKEKTCRPAYLASHKCGSGQTVN